MKLPASIRQLSRTAIGLRNSEAITPAELEATSKREDVLVVAIGRIDDRLPGEQRTASLANLAAVCAGVSRTRLIVTHCG